MSYKTERICVQCGVGYVPSRARQRYCSSKCFGSSIRVQGKRSDYPCMYVPGSYRGGKEKRIRVHRYVVEQHLGRKLEPWECVHHKNGNREDNRLENLEVMSRSEHMRLHMTPERARRMRRGIKECVLA